jgi:CheY-like chemotaxis protein
VYSEVGVGTTFKVYLPVSGGTPDAHEPALRAEVLGGRETVLVVEDEPAVREVVRAMLERRGYTVLLASDGEQAMRVSRTHESPIDLLLTDVVLPRSNGRRVAELLCMERPDLKVLFMSGYTEDAIHQHGELDEGVVLVEKPFTDLTLARRIRERLDHQ